MKRKSYYGKTILLLIISIVYTVLVSVVDKQAIGPEGTSVGFSAINKVVLDLISYNPMWDKVTDIMLMIAILTAAYFAVTGLMQIVKEKRHIMEVDKEILIMGFLYVILVIMYVVFDKIPFNYRPVLLPDETELEASFPSTHVLMICTIMGSAIEAWRERLYDDENLVAILRTCACVVMAIGVVGRVLAGVHWFSDICGGLLISATLISAYKATLDKMG